MATTLIKKLKFGTGNWDYIEIHAGTTIPEGNINAPSGSVYLYTNTTGGSAGAIFHKTTLSDTNTGWVNIKALATTTTNGLVRQAATSADTATAPSETYTQAEVQAILTELRDLKAKLRTAGILAT